MRARYDENGKVKSYHNMIFDEIPDNYKMQQIIMDEKVLDLSYLGVMKYLKDSKAGPEFSDNKFYSSEVLSHMAMDYLNSARYLYQGIIADRDGNTVSYYLIPCAFLCKHSIELKLKECQLAKGFQKLNGHSVLKIWRDLNETEIPHGSEITVFLEEVEKIDSNEMALRYGISKEFLPLQEKYRFNIDNLLINTMFLFNIVDEYVICKYR